MSRQLAPPLEWATFSTRPVGIGPARRRRGVRQRGLQYENSLARYLSPKALHGQWIKYADSEGTFYCQPDFIYPLHGAAVVIECKLAWTPDAEGQLGLYVPVVAAAAECKTFGLTVTKSLRDVPRSVFVAGSLDEALRVACTGTASVVFHWLGNASQLRAA